MTGTALAQHSLSVGAAPALMSFDEMHRRAMVLAKAHEVIPKPFHDNPEAIVFVGMRGAELGFSLGYAIENIDVIQGRAVPNAQARLTLIRRNGHEARFKLSTATKAILRARRKEYREDPEGWVEFEYTIEDARRAELTAVWVEKWVSPEGGGKKYPLTYIVGDDRGLNDELVETAPSWAKQFINDKRFKSKDNWRRDPISMLRARAATHITRMEFSDVMAGYAVEPYDADELEGKPVPTAADLDRDRKIAASMGIPLADDDDEPELDANGDPIVDLEPVEDEIPGEEAPGEPEPQPNASPPSPEAEPARPLARPLAQQIAIQAQNAGLVRGDVISAVTAGRTTSGKAVTPEEGQAVLDAIAKIVAGELVLEQDDNGGWRLREPAAVAPDGEELAAVGTPASDEDTWGTDEWRAFIALNHVKVHELLRKAHELAGEFKVDPPANLDALKGNPGLCAVLRGFVEELGEGRS
jgi:hypothetical protein